jgi:hypothetical protein
VWKCANYKKHITTSKKHQQNQRTNRTLNYMWQVHTEAHIKNTSQGGIQNPTKTTMEKSGNIYTHSTKYLKEKSSPATRHGGAWGERRYSSSFTTLALDGGKWSASRPGRAFTPGERTPGTHCTGGWVGPRAGLDTEARGKILFPCRGSNPARPVVQPVVRHYTDWANPALTIILTECVSNPVKFALSYLRVAG